MLLGPPLRKAINLAPTARSLPSGVPFVPLLSLAARAPLSAYDAHGHDLGAAAPRADSPPPWSGGVMQSYSVGMISKTLLNAPPSTTSQRRLLHTSPAARDEPQVPDFTPYEARSADTNRVFSYFMVGSFGVLSASVAKSTVTDFLGTLAASADVLALAKVEVELASIPEGKNIIVKWRGKPVFIRHRTPDEIREAQSENWRALRDPQRDEDRTQKAEWLVMLGVCTHLGCVPIGESGDYGGWFCPCHGSHYDISGRVRKGPAPTNLEVPEHAFNEAEGKLIIG